jgi:hypothetical protein
MALLGLCKNSVANKITFFLCSLLILCIAGFRYGLETDYWAYYNVFTNKNLLQDTEIELGYRYINILFRTYVSKDFNWFITFCSFLFIGIKLWLFYQHNQPLLALVIYFLLFFIFFDLNAIRQGIAIAWLFLAGYSLSQNRIHKYFIYTTIAVFIHISSIAFFLVFFIRRNNFTLMKITILLLSTLIIRLYFFAYVFNMFINILNLFPIDFLGRIPLLLTRYFSSNIKFVFTIGMLRKIIFLFLLFLLNRSKNIKNIYFNIYMMNIIISILLSGISTVGYRLSLGLESFLPFATVTCLKKFSWKECAIITIMLLLSFGVYLLSLSNSESAIPYRTYLLNFG